MDLRGAGSVKAEYNYAGGIAGTAANTKFSNNTVYLDAHSDIDSECKGFEHGKDSYKNPPTAEYVGYICAWDSATTSVMLDGTSPNHYQMGGSSVEVTTENNVFSLEEEENVFGE